ncbi:MAG: pyrroline-5-carboxylate reductase [Pseudomonadota bacterium]
MKILQIGGGNMGGALLARWSEGLDWSFTLVDPGAPEVPTGVHRVGSLQALKQGDFDLLVVAVKPQIVEPALAGVAHYLRRDAVIVSVAAGTPVDLLANLLGPRPIVRAMPNMPVRIGEGLTGLFGNTLLDPEDRTVIDQLFEPTGASLWLDDEDSIDRFTAIAGSGPGYLFEMLRSYAAAAEALGFDRHQAEFMAAQTVRGAVELARETHAPYAALRDSVTSKGGTTAAGLQVFGGPDGFEGMFREGTKAAYDRARELRG